MVSWNLFSQSDSLCPWIHLCQNITEMYTIDAAIRAHFFQGFESAYLGFRIISSDKLILDLDGLLYYQYHVCIFKDVWFGIDFGSFQHDIPSYWLEALFFMFLCYYKRHVLDHGENHYLSQIWILFELFNQISTLRHILEWFYLCSFPLTYL